MLQSVLRSTSWLYIWQECVQACASACSFCVHDVLRMPTAWQTGEACLVAILASGGMPGLPAVAAVTMGPSQYCSGVCLLHRSMWQVLPVGAVLEGVHVDVCLDTFPILLTMHAINYVGMWQRMNQC